jgi:hypothetical protein
VCVFLAIFTVGSRAHSVCGGEHAGSVRGQQKSVSRLSFSLTLSRQSIKPREIFLHSRVAVFLAINCSNAPHSISNLSPCHSERVSQSVSPSLVNNCY